MKKWIWIVLGILAAGAAAAAVWVKTNWSWGISKVGGAYGPTAVYIVAKTEESPDTAETAVIAAAALLLCALGIWLIKRRR